MPSVLVLLGSKSDAPVAEKVAESLKRFSISYSVHVASAHRSPERVVKLIRDSHADVFIGIAGVSAALPGVIAAHTTKPVIGVPVSGKVNLDAILSVVQMPPGIPVAAVGLDRGENAGLLAASILSIKDPKVAESLAAYRQEMAKKIEADSKEVEAL
ncbi:MAG: 5-(carboxyamino)imidazole ribonucleotide mutase [Thermoplasmatota archaeon]